MDNTKIVENLLAGLKAPGTPRLCKDCKYFKNHSWFDKLFWLGTDTSKIRHCGNPALDSSHSGLVLGTGDSFCSVNRCFEHLCGPEGRYWEPK